MLSLRSLCTLVVLITVYAKHTSGFIPSAAIKPPRASTPGANNQEDRAAFSAKHLPPITHSGNHLVAPLHDSIRASASNEDSRRYRRTVYTYADWPQHRSPDRFQNAVGTILISQVYKGLSLQVITFSFISTLAVVWNSLAGGYTDFQGVQHEALFASLPLLVLPLQIFTLTSGSLGLLLGK